MFYDVLRNSVKVNCGSIEALGCSREVLGSSMEVLVRSYDVLWRF